MGDYYSNARTDVIELLSGGQFGKILEIGGGYFPTLRALQQLHSAEAWGVDIHPVGAQGITFVNGSIEDEATVEKIPDKYFDLILANDVIEHLEDTEKFFSVVKDKLRPGGVLAISVPNVRQIRLIYYVTIKGTFPRHDAGLFDRTHLRWFCKADILRLARNTGFSVTLAKTGGRFVPERFARWTIFELLGLQNLFLLQAPEK